MAERPLRIGMIGAGWVTAHHLPAWEAERARAVVVAICDPNAAAAARRAEAFGIRARHERAEAMLARGGLDAVDVCSPRETHAAMVGLAADHSLPVLCQKPLAPTLAAARALVDRVAGRVPLMVHENWRFRPYYRRLRAWLDAGRVGSVRQVSLDFHSSGMLPDAHGRRPALERQPFFARERRLLVMEVLIHHLDTLRYLLGEIELDAARLERSNDAIVGEDIAVLALRRRSDGVPIFVSGNLAVPGAPPVPRDVLRIVGSRGVVALDGARLSLDGAVRERVDFDPEESYAASYRGAIGHFLDGLERGGAFETAPEDNLRTLALVEAAYRTSGFETTPPSG